MTKDTYKSKQIISFSPVDGWRVVFLDDNEPSGIWIDPMAGWITVAETIMCNRTFNPIEDQPPLTERSRDVRPAIYTDFMEDATEIESFWKLLAPGQPDPTPEEIAARKLEAAEIERRRQQRQKAS